MSSTAPSVTITPTNASSSYLNDTLKTQEHQSSGAATASALNLSGSLTLDSAEVASSVFPSLDQGEVAFQAQNCLPTSSLNDVESFNAAMARVCANLPQVFAAMQSLNLFGQNQLAQLLQNLSNAGLVPTNNGQATDDATAEENVSGGDQASQEPDGATEKASSQDAVTEKSQATYQNQEGSDDYTTDSGDSTDETGTDSISIQQMLDDIALLIQMQNNCTETMQQAMIQQNIAECSALLQAAQATGKEGQGPVNAATTGMIVAAVSCGATMGTMGYASNEASNAEDQQVAEQNANISEAAEGSASYQNEAAHQLNSSTDGKITLSDKTNKTYRKNAATLNHPTILSKSVSENSQVVAQKGQQTERLIAVNNSSEDLKSAQKTVTDTLASGGIPSDEDLNKLEEATTKFQAACGKLTQNDLNDLKEVNPNFASDQKQAIDQSNALVATGRAKNSIKNAIDNPSKENSDKAEKDPNNAKTKAAGTKGEKFLNELNKHYDNAFTKANNNNKSAPMEELEAKSSFTPEVITKETTTPLGAVKESVGAQIQSNATISSRFAEKTTASAHSYKNSKIQQQTQTVNNAVQELDKAGKNYAKNPTNENAITLHQKASKLQGLLEKNPDADPETVTHAKAAVGAVGDGKTGKPNTAAISEHAQASQKATDSVTKNNKATAKSANYYNNFQAIVGLFGAINTLTQAGNQMIYAEGQANSKSYEKTAQIDQAASTSYGAGEQDSVSNAQLQSQTLESLESTYQSISQSQVQDVQFVRGAN